MSILEKMQAKTLILFLVIQTLGIEWAASSQLDKDFAAPPDATRPRCYWYWMDGQVTKEGITKDLEAMKRVGIGEGYIGIISGQSGKAATNGCKALTDEWWSYIEHAIREGGRLGVDIGMFNSPGWSQSGGPWVKPNQAMRYVTLPEMRLHGPMHFEGKLPTPEGFFQDIAVMAFPAPAGEAESATINGRTPTNIIFSAEGSFTARSITVQPIKEVNVIATLQASDDGQAFRNVKQFNIDRHNLGVSVGPVHLAPVVASFPATIAKFFRLNFSTPCEVGEVRLSPAAKVATYAEKSLAKAFQDPHPPFDFYSWPAQDEPDSASLVIDPAKARDLSTNVYTDGTLRWDVPAGDWIVLRAVMSPTGTKNSPAPAEATGLEVDKMNRDPLKVHFDAYLGELLRRMPPSERAAWKHVVADSYEQGPQNWTDGFAADFQKRYGYDPLPWLPVLTGRVVGSSDQSDRFLWDLRRLVADRVALDYVGGLRDLCHQHGLRMWLENYGHWGFPAEFLQYGGACDEIGGEFWANANFANDSDSGYLGRVELPAAASSAHIYGKKAVWAEAFTGGPAFINAPRDLKALGDWALCEGINQFVFHVYIHQPWDDKVPGINAWFGTEFNRHNTWFNEAKPWVDYLRRCSVMLQAGQPVADVAYFIGEDAPKMAGLRKPELPHGRDFDYINAEVIEKYLSVKNGRLTLPSGLSYRVLVLPESPTMRPEVLEKIRDLIKAGATVLGPPPMRSPSMEDFPRCDERVRELAREIWGDSNPTVPGERQLGKGKMVWGKNLDDVLAELDSKPDFESSIPLRFKHRRDGETDVYFVANPKNETVTANVALRATGRTPELWWPDSGRTECAAIFDEADGRLRMPMTLGPNGSMFVVFREKAAKAASVVSVSRDGTEVLRTDFKPYLPPSGTNSVGNESPNNFSFAVWVNPSADTALPGEKNQGVARRFEPRNEVFTPPHGDTFGGHDHAGCGLAVGRNGVTVIEHGANYFVPTLVYPTMITNWTHVAVVYRDGQPSLYLDGVLVRTGQRSSHVVHSGGSGVSGASFSGKLGECINFSRSLSDGEAAALAKSMPPPSTHKEIAVPINLTRNAKGTVTAHVALPGSYELKFSDGQVKKLNVADLPAQQEIGGAWEVSFDPKWGGPGKLLFDSLDDWATRSEEGIRFYSGPANYRKTFKVSAAALRKGATVILDLGQVCDLATVRVNGCKVATLWIAPWQADITPALKPGMNDVEIEVVNAWNNRLAGDASLPEAERRTFLTTQSVKPGASLRSAGLLGPVSLRTIETIELK